METTNEDLTTDRGRLKLLVALAAGTIAETPAGLSKLAGLSQALVGMVLRKDIKALSTEAARAIARVTGCSVGWLLAGEGVPPESRDIREAVERARTSRQPAGTVHTANDFEVATPRPAVVVARPTGELRIERDSFSQVEG